MEEENRNYEEISEIDKLKRVMTEYLESYNIENSK